MDDAINKAYKEAYLTGRSHGLRDYHAEMLVAWEALRKHMVDTYNMMTEDCDD